jgi:G3E family GTPase
METHPMTTNGRVPVTVLTGFLGSGKTTLLNRILSERHGKRIAVIENEFGEVGVDHQLVIGAEEEIFETANGCICCTVRGDLIRVLGQLVKRRDRFDYVMIETTGLADPGPVAQTFFLDDDLKDQFSLDAIVTLVDAKHAEQHLDDVDAAREQIAFADIVLLNKTDLVASDDVARVERRIRGINPTAKLMRTQAANAPVASVLDVGAFDLDRVLSVNSTFLDAEQPFEWGGIYHFDAGSYSILSGKPGTEHHHGHEAADHVHLALLVVPVAAPTVDELDGHVRDDNGDKIELEVGHPFKLSIASSGHYAVFCEHAPDEFNLRIEGATPLVEKEFASHHHHDEDIISVGISDPRALSLRKLEDWISYLLQSRGQDIFRMKGVIHLAGEDRRYVFHGVHMMFDGRLERSWGGLPRHNSLVFIGRKLDRNELEAGFESCVA